jgi:hypothetical protein
MNLYIETDNNGNTINHPAFEDNLLEAFGQIPPHWEPFVRIEKPVPKLYEILDSEEPIYQKVDGVWTDVWSIRDMTVEEKTQFQQLQKDVWKALPNYNNFTSWIFDEETCRYEPPIPYPTDGQNYFWQGTTNTWQLRPPYPTDGKTYKLDFATSTWIEITE